MSNENGPQQPDELTQLLTVSRGDGNGRPPAREGRGQSKWIPIVAIVATLAVVAAAIFLWARHPAGIGIPTASHTPSPTPIETPTPTPTPTPTVIPTYPLTGMPAMGEVGPALCIKIENSVDARPQLGLDSADIVYEEVVEGGITRYMGVFQSTIPPQVEPVRSLRPMDPNIALPLNCALIFSGGQTPFIDAAKATGLQLMYQDRGDAGFSRDGKRAAPHNVIGTMATFLSKVDASTGNGTQPTAPAFAYPADGALSTAAAGGTPTSTLTLKLSSVSNPHWTWDADSGTWLRFEGAKPAVVRVGASATPTVQLSAVNVVALSVKVVNTQYKDPANNPVPETEINNSSGTGVVASGGKSVPITWSKGAATDQIVLTDAAGSPVTLEPGNTWVELVPTSGTITPS